MGFTRYAHFACNEQLRTTVLRFEELRGDVRACATQLQLL
jgi:hypothetical protein